jgi:hypothetical protein
MTAGDRWYTSVSCPVPGCVLTATHRHPDWPRTTCYRLTDNGAGVCRNCGRGIVRREGVHPGNYSLQHEGPSIAARLAELNAERAR